MNTAKLLRNVPLPDELQDVNDNGIVVDLGSYLTKIGYSGDDSPKLVSRTAVCKRDASKEYQCWQNALKARQNGVNLTYPLNDGTVHDWEALETMMKSLYSDVLRIDPTDTATPLLLTESVLIDRKQRETMATILFEKIGTPLLYFSLSPVLSLFSSGRGTGVAIEMGYDNCSVTPVFEGFALFHSIGKTTYGGRRTTESVLKILREDGCKFEPVFENDIASYVKEKLCRVNTRGTLPISEETLRLPDGTQIRMEKQRHLVCEPFFESNGKEQIGIQNLLLESARKCDSDVSSTLLSNIVLAGGSSLFSGMLERLTQELTDLMPTEKFRIHAASERKHASWVGGSILASLPTFRDMCVTKMDYDEVGASIVHRNCF